MHAEVAAAPLGGSPREGPVQEDVVGAQEAGTAEDLDAQA